MSISAGMSERVRDVDLDLQPHRLPTAFLIEKKDKYIIKEAPI